jgi:hypothetical protein
MRPLDFRDERGVMAVLFAVVLTVILMTTAVVWDAGNWWTHRKHLQTKADAAAFAGGGVWGFPCGDDSDVRIVAEARKYAGPHRGPANQDFTGGTTFNPQIGGTPGDNIHVVLNGADWWDDDAGLDPADSTSPVGSICEAAILDVKATEENNLPLFGMIPFFPDLKRRARVEIQEVQGLSGLLPISVRVPKPVSAAAVFYDEESGNILPGGVKYFCEQPGGFTGLPAGLAGWTTYDPTHASGLCPTQASLNVAPSTGVVIATSVRPACDATITINCFEDSGFATVNELCRQRAGLLVKCFYGTGRGASQSVQSGLQFIHGYADAPPAVTNGPPELRGAWLTGGGCVGGYGNGYFASVTGTCAALLEAKFDLGSCMRGPAPPLPDTICFPDPSEDPPIETRTTDNTEVKYTIVYGTGNSDDICNFGPTCDLDAAWSQALSFDAQNTRYAIALRVRLKNTFVPNRPACSNPGFGGGCEWYYTADGRQLTQPSNAEIFANPVQRSFMGDDDTSGPIKFLRLSADRGCDGNPDLSGNGLPNYIDGEAASQPFGQAHCFVVEMGLAGSVAITQDEPPIAFNLAGTSQSALLDCDPDISNIKDEIVEGCKPFYAKNDFTRDPPCPSGVTSWSGMQSPAPPFDAEWPPYTCALTQTTGAPAPGQLIAGFNERVFGDPSNPTCPTENTLWTGPPAKAPFTQGRNYWHDANNQIDEYTFARPPLSNRLGMGGYDPRIINLFMTTYDSFGGSGNEIFPIVVFGTFYVTGWGRVTGGGLTIDDPCTDGNNGNLFDGTGNEPPPDLKTSIPGTYVWGHLIKYVVPAPDANPSGRRCAPADDPQPCVAVLVE